MRTKFNFNHLECFYSLAKTLSFSKTSEELNIAQPAVSKQIKTLEGELSVQLFLRTKQSVALSQIGKKFYDETWPIYNELITRSHDIFSPTDELIGNLTFGCLEEVGENVFIHAINEFKLLHPKIQFNVKFLKALEIIEEVKLGTIDIGIVPNKIDQANITAYEILSENIVLVTSKKNSKTSINKIETLNFVAFREHDPLIEFYIKKVNPNCKLSKLNLEFIVNSHKAMISVIKKQNLYAILPTLSIRKELLEGSLVNVGPKDLTSNLYLIHSSNEFLDKKIVALRNFLRNYQVT